MMLFASSLFAADGGLDTGTIDNLRNNFHMDAHTRAMYNAITNTDIKDMALNRDLLRRHNELFSHKIDTKGVTSQKSSGRCWLFAGLNIMRPAVIEKYKLDKFEFSQNYLAFWDKLEKANTFYEMIIELADRPTDDREMEIRARRIHRVSPPREKQTATRRGALVAARAQLRPRNERAARLDYLSSILHRRTRTGSRFISTATVHLPLPPP